MVVNVLVEASTLGSLGAARPALPIGQQCEVMRRQFKEASDACSRALGAAQPVLCEPVICITTGSQKTCDPCCLVCAQPLLAIPPVCLAACRPGRTT